MLSSKTHVVSCINTQRLHSQLSLSSGPPTECNNILSVTGFNASSSDGNTGSSLDVPQLWGSTEQSPWLELELTERSTITGRRFKLRSSGLVLCFWKPFLLFPGVITTGSAQRYIESYVVYFSKDRKNWKPHKDVVTKEKKVAPPPPHRRGLSLGRRFPW